MASIKPKPIKAPGGKIASKKGESKCTISTLNTCAHSPNNKSAPSNKVPLPNISRIAPKTKSAAVAPNPIAKPSIAEGKTSFLAANASARPITIQLVTIRGINIPNDWYKP